MLVLLSEQGCQMVYFQATIPNLGKFLRALDWKMLIYLMAIWEYFTDISGYVYDHLEYFTDILGYFMTIWNILPTFRYIL
jgi:hypothetical protein